MPKGKNDAESEIVRLTLSKQSAALLKQLAEKGIYGRNAAEVAARFVDVALERFVETPRFKLDGKGG